MTSAICPRPHSRRDTGRDIIGRITGWCWSRGQICDNERLPHFDIPEESASLCTGVDGCAFAHAFVILPCQKNCRLLQSLVRCRDANAAMPSSDLCA